MHNYRNYCADSSQIVHNDKNHQMLFVGRPRWRTSNWRKMINRHISAMVWPIAAKFGTNDALWPSPPYRLLKSRTFKNQDGGRPPAWKSKNGDILVSVWQIAAKSGTVPDFAPIGQCATEIVRFSIFKMSAVRRLGFSSIFPNLKIQDVGPDRWMKPKSWNSLLLLQERQHPLTGHRAPPISGGT